MNTGDDVPYLGFPLPYDGPTTGTSPFSYLDVVYSRIDIFLGVLLCLTIPVT